MRNLQASCDTDLSELTREVVILVMASLEVVTAAIVGSKAPSILKLLSSSLELIFLTVIISPDSTLLLSRSVASLFTVSEAALAGFSVNTTITLPGNKH